MSIYQLLKKPRLWQRSDAPFWDDEHISKQMLAAHLDETIDAASRKPETINKSVNFILSRVPQGCRILDLGCGPGLYCRRLSEAGCDTTGIDFAKRSIAYAREHDTKTVYRYENYLECDYGGGYDAILMIYCDYAALTSCERQTLLSKVYTALKPGGVFIFDVFTDEFYRGKTERTELSEHPNGGFWSDKPHILIESDYLFENNTVSVNQNVVITENDAVGYLIWDTVYDADRLTNEVSLSGLTVREIYGDVCGSKYDRYSKTLCAIAEKPDND